MVSKSSCCLLKKKFLFFCFSCISDLSFMLCLLPLAMMLPGNGGSRAGHCCPECSDSYGPDTPRFPHLCCHNSDISLFWVTSTHVPCTSYWLAICQIVHALVSKAFIVQNIAWGWRGSKEYGFYWNKIQICTNTVSFNEYWALLRCS